MASPAFEELSNSPIEQFTRDGTGTATRHFKVEWDDRIDFAAYLLYGDGGLPVIYPAASVMRVDTVSVNALVENPSGGFFSDPAVDLVSHDKAVVTATYRPFDTAILDQGNNTAPDDYELPEGTWMTYTSDYSGEFITIPTRTMVWLSTAQPVAPDAHPTLLVPTADHKITWHQVRYPPYDAISEMRGCINDATFRIPATYQRFAPGTMLFMGASVRRDYKLTGETAYQLEYTFKERAVKNLGAAALPVRLQPGVVPAIDAGWNELYNDAQNYWDTPLDATNNDTMYTAKDFSPLFDYP